MADLATINAKIGSTTFVELVVGEFCLCLVPRLATLRAWYSSLVLYFFIRSLRLQRYFKVCFYILEMPPSYFSASSTFTSVISKFFVTPVTALTDIAVRAFVRWHWLRCLTLVLGCSETIISRSIYGSRAPRTILSSIIPQSNQWVILARLPIGH